MQAIRRRLYLLGINASGLSDRELAQWEGYLTYTDNQHQFASYQERIDNGDHLVI